MITSLDVLEPGFRSVFIRFLRICRDDLWLDVRIIETLRGAKRQADLLAAGKTKNVIGWHQYGRAADVGVFVDDRYQTDDASGLYLKVGFVAMAVGLRWGGNWDQDKNIAEPGESDLGHVEYHPGLTLADMPAPPVAGLT